MPHAFRRLVALGYGARRALGKAFITLIFPLSVASAAVSAELPEIVALGDSLTAGYGLAEGEGFVPQLQAWLDAQGVPAHVVNAGVSGDTSAGGLARLDWSLTPETDALIVTLGGNDLLRGLDPATTRASLEAILQKAAARQLPVLLIGLPGPANFGPDWKAEFDAIFPDLAAKYGVMMEPNFFAGLGTSDPAATAPLMQADRIHPNPEGVKRIVAYLGPRVQALLKAP
ncbi:arylesterase [Gemmobacter caeruleus]|uniref:arylesterase n=1 Tax=Gemmobacter caeruleus TaxID=2595004 RepID=UPI0011EF8CD2|nr:arylesterase [Gemmobacter caeruleus]